MKELEINALKEKIHHGDRMFPFCVYNNEFRYNEHILNCHWHQEVEFIYMAQGSAVFQVDITPIQVQRGQAVIINSGILHSGYALDQSSCRYYAVVFDLNMLSSDVYDGCQSKFITPLLHNRYGLPSFIGGKEVWEQEVLGQISAVIDLFKEKPWGYELGIKACLYKIFASIVMQRKYIEVKKQNNGVAEYKIERLKKVLNYIQDHYHEKISVDDLSGEINLSSYYFSRFFKSLTGKTCIEYINYYRINQAVRLLENEERKIMDIALETGFDNLSYFIKTFKQYKNCTPSAYRHRIKQIKQ
ncbi:MAG: AraC family transcriptional regulator [Firmicutes bacterium]|nr:AraC family transcriptional regulator [Bacillota bacterium]